MNAGALNDNHLTIRVAGVITMRKKRFIIFFILISGIFILALLIRNEWVHFGTEHMPGRDTVAYWEIKKEGYVYEILRTESEFSFFAFNSLNAGEIPYRIINDVHFYSDTPSYIFLITNDSHYYSVEKREGLISASLSFDAVPSTVEQVRFINLLNKSGAERSRWYIE